MTDKPRVTRLPRRNLQAVPKTPRPGTHNREVSETSRAAGQTPLRFRIMVAAESFADGNHQVGLTALCDAVFVAHTGNYERMTNLDLIMELRKIAGHGWSPEEGPGEAA